MLLSDVVYAWKEHCLGYDRRTIKDVHEVQGNEEDLLKNFLYDVTHEDLMRDLACVDASKKPSQKARYLMDLYPKHEMFLKDYARVQENIEQYVRQQEQCGNALCVEPPEDPYPTSFTNLLRTK